MAKKSLHKNSNTSLLEGKMPPQALDFEEVILGALMLEKDAHIKIASTLSPQAFYKDAHQYIYQAILNLTNKEKPVDILTVIEELKRMDKLEQAGGEVYVAQLTDRFASSAHIEDHAFIVFQKFIQRQLIKAATNIHNNAFDESIDVADLLDEAQQEIYEIAEKTIRQDVSHVSHIIDETLDLLAKLKVKKDGLRGIPSGFSELDRITSGWQKSDLIIVAARPAMGKTALALSMARNMAVDHSHPVGIFSMEMSSRQLVNRLLASETGLDQSKIRDGKLAPYEWEQIQTKIDDLVDSPIYIDDTPALSIYELRAKCRRLKTKYDIKTIIVDYLQLMNSGGNLGRSGTREQEVSMISRQLKMIARELDIPVIALSQLNRGVETRRDSKRPLLADLRESGAIEQDADLVLFIHRPEQYGITEDENNRSLIGIAEIIISKHRNGRTGSIELRFRKEIARFIDLEDDMEGLSPIGEGEIKEFSSKMNTNDDDFNTGLTGEDFDKGVKPI